MFRSLLLKVLMESFPYHMVIGRITLNLVVEITQSFPVFEGKCGEIVT